MPSITFKDDSIATTTWYQPIYDENKKIIKENFLTNSLNVLGYIPGISTISGIVRMIFATIMLLKTGDDRYKNHIARGALEVIPLSGLVLLICDVIHAVFLKYKKNSITVPNINKTENWFKL